MSLVFKGSLPPLPAAKVQYIVVHTAGPATGADQSAAQLHAYHLSKGWAGLGYHLVIRKDGTVEPGRPLDRVGAQVEGLNSRSVGVCCTGNGDLADFTPAQHKALSKVLAELMRRFDVPLSRVLGHRETYTIPGVPNTGKTCPGRKVNMSQVREGAVRAMVDSLPEVKLRLA